MFVPRVGELEVSSLVALRFSAGYFFTVNRVGNFGGLEYWSYWALEWTGPSLQPNTPHSPI